MLENNIMTWRVSLEKHSGERRQREKKINGKTHLKGNQTLKRKYPE
jgi:hypothetical protein